MERNQKNKVKGNGEGTIYLNKSTNKLVGQYVVNGKRHSVYQKKYEKTIDFKKRFKSILHSIDEGSYVEKNKETLYLILKNYIEQKHDDGITGDRAYIRDLETLAVLEKTCPFIKKDIQKVRIIDIEQSKKFIREYSKSSIDKIWRLLQKGFKIAYSRRKIAYNLMEDETLTKPLSRKNMSKIVALDLSEEKHLNKILDNEERNHKYRNIVKTQLITGMRIGEVLARSIDDINNEKHTLFIHNTLTVDENGHIILGEHTKTYNKKTGIDEGERYFPIIDALKEILDEQLSSKLTNMYKLLFWDYEKNTFISPSEINSWLKRLNKKYKITNKRFSSHVLRHTPLTRWNEQGIDMKVIQYLAGHVEGSRITNNVYINLTPDFIEKESRKIK